MKKLKGAGALALLILCSFVSAETPAPPVPAIPAEPAVLPAGKPPSLKKVDVLQKNIAKYGKVEIRGDIVSDGQNPFDPDEIRVEAHLVSPSGVKKVAPAFFYAAKHGEMEGDDWRVRFSPDEKGQWEGDLVVIGPHGEKDSESFEFECTMPALPAPIRVCRQNPAYFERADGEFFYPLGHNVCWGSVADYEAHFSKMHQNGENWSRIWIAPWNVDIEWSDRKPGFHGLGQYNLKNAEKLDQIMDLAERYAIELQLVLHEHCRIATQWNPEWQNNPYNKALGGPCDLPPDFFTDPEALRLERNRIRYIIARWGYSSRVMAWELFNEVNLGDGFDQKTDTAWHLAMAQYIKKTDPHGRMVTTSYAGEPNSEVFSLPEIDFTQLHVYDEAIVEKFIEAVKPMSEYNKPYFIGEFGRNSADGVDKKDTKGMFLHTGIWAQFMMPSGGNAMSWWWYDLIKPSNLYHRFGSLNAFATGIDRRNEKWNWQYGGLAKDSQSPRVLSLTSPRTVMFWIYNPKILPYTEKMPESMPDIEGEITIENLSPGKWTLEKWEPYNSYVPSREVPRTDETSEDGRMTIKIKALGPDCAYRMTLASNDKTKTAKCPTLKLESWEGESTGQTSQRTKVSVSKLASPVSVDGDLADWPEAAFCSVGPKDGSKPENRSFRFALSHDSDNLYVACEVKDDEVVRENKGENLWKDDCVELWIDAHHDAGKLHNMPRNPGLYQINLAPPAAEGGPVEIAIFRNPRPSDSLKAAIKAVSRRNPDGYSMEISIPLAELRGQDALKPEMGFNISICDADKHGKQKGTWVHLVWQGTKEEDATQWSDAILEP